MTAVVLPFAPAAERRRSRAAAGALAGVPLYRVGRGIRAHAIRWSFPALDDGYYGVILRCGRYVRVEEGKRLDRAGTDRPVCTRCASSTYEVGIPAAH